MLPWASSPSSSPFPAAASSSAAAAPSASASAASSSTSPEVCGGPAVAVRRVYCEQEQPGGGLNAALPRTACRCRSSPPRALREGLRLTACRCVVRRAAGCSSSLRRTAAAGCGCSRRPSTSSASRRGTGAAPSLAEGDGAWGRHPLPPSASGACEQVGAALQRPRDLRHAAGGKGDRPASISPYLPPSSRISSVSAPICPYQPVSPPISPNLERISPDLPVPRISWYLPALPPRSAHQQPEGLSGGSILQRWPASATRSRSSSRRRASTCAL